MASAPEDHWVKILRHDDSRSIDNLAGSAAINCGYYDLLKKDNHNHWKNAARCFKYSTENKLPFKYATYRIPVDSELIEILLVTENMTPYRIAYYFVAH
ncbi:MAG: hypothetical protein JKY54_18825 [Flavobacteriales bacterium]|nr:hypothetical protein [Flavobacteriales bacterium]